MKKIRDVLNGKKGGIILIVFGVMVCIFFPMMAVLYDIGQMRYYQSEVKNAQEIAGLACVGVSGGSAGSSSATAAGAFDPGPCQTVATISAWSNLGVQANAMSSQSASNMDTTWLRQVKENKAKTRRLVPCTSGEGPNVKVSDENTDKHHFIVHITGLCYRPVFLKPSIINFRVLKKYSNMKIDVPDEFPIQVQPSWFSAVYNAAQ